jgi:tetratricopeptide (TPR) repeat protein
MPPGAKSSAIAKIEIGKATGAAPPKIPMAVPTLKGVAPAPSSSAGGGGVHIIEEDPDETGPADVPIDLDDGGGPNKTGSVIEIGEGGLADAEAALEAMQSFRLAEGALQKNDTVAAEEHARKAVAGDPNQPDYVTLLAWIRSLVNTPKALEDAIRTMSKVLIEDPSNERALFYRGKLLIRTNRLPEALHDFNELLSANPHHREAQNEARQLKSKLPS